MRSTSIAKKHPNPNKAKTQLRAYKDPVGRHAYHNPNPTFRIQISGKVLYANAAAQILLNSLPSEDRALHEYRLGILAEKALDATPGHRVEFHIGSNQYRIDMVPTGEGTEVDCYLTEISDNIRIRNYFEVQSHFATSLLQADSIQDVVSTITRETILRLGYEDCVVYLLAEDGKTLVQSAAHNTNGPRDVHGNEAITLQVGEGICGTVARQLKAEIVHDTSIDPRYVADDATRLSEIAVPILDGNNLIGVIDSEHSMRHYYGIEDLSLLTALASMAATKIQKIKSAEAIRASQDKTRHLIENAFGGIYILRDNRFELVNQRFKEITGYTKLELTSPAFVMSDLIYKASDGAQQAMEARAMGDKTPKSYQLEIRTKHQQIRRLTVNTTIVEDERGPYTLGIVLDITQLIESERALEKLNEELGSRNEELKQFAHIASHNLRSPVSNVVGLLEIFDAQVDIGDHNRHVIAALKEAAESLNTTLEDMHHVLKMRAQAEDCKTKISLKKSMDKACDMLKCDIQTTGVKISSGFEPDEIEYVAPHIDNFLYNLLSNAIKYRNPQVQPEVELTSKRAKEGIILTVRDNGIGIDLERHGKDLFGMYKTFHNHPDSRGIGLYLVRNQLESLGGSIKVYSSPGQGTTFRLYIKTCPSS